MPTVRLAAMLLVCGAVTQADAAPVQLLGVDIAGAPMRKLQRCPTDTRKPVKQTCAMHAPFVASDGGSAVTVRVPGTEEMPAWAEFAQFSVALDRNRMVESLTLRFIPAAQRHEVARSITARFGLPTWTNLAASGTPAGATWSTADIEVMLACDALPSGNCSVSFTARAVHDALQQANRKREQARKGL